MREPMPVNSAYDARPMPNQRPFARAFFLCHSQGVVTDRVTSHMETFLEAGLIPHDAGRNFVRKLARADEIAQPDVLGIEAKLCGSHVDQPFHDESRGRAADATVRAGWSFRGRDRAHTPTVMLDTVGPGQEAHHLQRLERRRPWIDRIGADVANHVRAQRHESAVGIEAQFSIDDLIEALAVAGQILHAIAGPPDGACEPARSRADENLLGIKRALASEAAADIRCHHADLVAGQVERSGQGIAQDAGDLRRRMQSQRIAPGVIFGKACARLDRHRCLTVHAEPTFDTY